MDVYTDIRHGGDHASGYHWRYDVVDATGKVLAHGERKTRKDACVATADYIARCGYHNRGPWHAHKAS